MKRLLVILMTVGLFGVTPVLAAEHGGMKMETDEHVGMKMDTDEGVRECALQAESLQQKIKRIQGEIKNGSKKYSAEELKKLEDKLKDANQFLDQLNRP